MMRCDVRRYAAADANAAAMGSPTAEVPPRIKRFVTLPLASERRLLAGPSPESAKSNTPPLEPSSAEAARASGKVRPVATPTVASVEP